MPANEVHMDALADREEVLALQKEGLAVRDDGGENKNRKDGVAAPLSVLTVFLEEGPEGTRGLAAWLGVGERFEDLRHMVKAAAGSYGDGFFREGKEARGLAFLQGILDKGGGGADPVLMG